MHFSDLLICWFVDLFNLVSVFLKSLEFLNPLSIEFARSICCLKAPVVYEKSYQSCKNILFEYIKYMLWASIGVRISTRCVRKWPLSGFERYGLGFYVFVFSLVSVCHGFIRQFFFRTRMVADASQRWWTRKKSAKIRHRSMRSVASAFH